MYKAYVTKIFTEPAPGFDNLVLGRCKGYQVLVGKDTENGQLGVFFGTDGQLSEEFAKMNDLIRRKNPDGSKAGGMFEENRRVKSIKMKGVKSDGFWCPLSLFEYTGFDLSTLKEGDQFDELNGNAICNKYETPATIRAKNKQGKEGIPNVKILKNLATFPEHIETGHFVREAQLIQPGALIMISDKLHGCLTYGEMISMADGSRKAIIDVKQGEYVLGLNEKNELVPSKVLQKFDGGKSPGWLQVKIERQPIGYSNQYISVKCTPEHWFFAKEKQDYVCAKDLNPGDTVVTVANAEQEIKPSKEQIELLFGKLLGDGSLFIRKESAYISYGHSSKDLEYLKYCHKLLGYIQNPDIRSYMSGYGSEMYRTQTKYSFSLKNIFSGFNEDKYKFLLDYGNQYLTPLAFAFWYMDDGSLAHNDTQQDRLVLAVCRYSDAEVELLCDILANNFGITPIKFKDSKGFSRIRINTKDAYKMFDLIYKYIPSCMARKLPSSYSHLLKDDLYIPQNKPQPFLIDCKVLEVIPCKIKSQRYDMETETHNYFANKVLVHNTSHRVTTTLCTTSPFYNGVEKVAYKLFAKYPKVRKILPYLKRFKHFCFNYLSTKVWLKINGTRHTVMEFKEPDNLGFYGSEEFRYRITEKFTPHKNEVIYGEIVGYTDSGAAIMKRHNTTVFKSKEAEKRFGKEMTYKYGCLEGTCDFYVYRICSVNEDGIVTEYSWPQVVRRCQELGLKTVPVLETFIYDGNEEALRKKVDVMVNGESGTELVPDPLDASHTQEGVVVRYENPNGHMDWLKHKAWAFGVMEGHLKLDDTFIDLEEVS